MLQRVLRVVSKVWLQCVFARIHFGNNFQRLNEFRVDSEQTLLYLVQKDDLVRDDVSCPFPEEIIQMDLSEQMKKHTYCHLDP